MKIFISILLTIFLAAIAFAQSALTNKDVIDMVATGLSETVIISKIKTSKTAFNTEVSDLKALQDAKVPDSVVAAMVEKAAEKKVPTEEIRFVFEDAEHGSLSEIGNKTKIFLMVPDLQAREIIEKALNKSGLQVVNYRSECDFAIAFGMQTVEAGSNALLGTVSNKVVVGDMLAYTYLPVPENATKGHVRIVWQTRKTQDWSGGLTLNRHPAQNAINEFLKDFKKNNK